MSKDRHPDIGLLNDIEHFLFQIDCKIYKLLRIKIPSCEHYERLEQCCNDFREKYNFCDYMCFYGISGSKRLLFSKIFFHVTRFVNTIINKFKR